MKAFSQGDRVTLMVKHPPLMLGVSGTVISTKPGNISYGETSWYVGVIFDTGHRIDRLHQGYFVLEYPSRRKK